MKIEKIKAILFRKITFRMSNKHHVYHYSHNFLYCTYFGTIVEKAGWSLYGVSAGGLLILVIVGLFIGEAE